MKKAKTYILKRILCFLLVGCITSASVFISYSNTLIVKADSNGYDAVKSFVIIIMTYGGLFFAPEVTVPMILSALGTTVIEGTTIVEYLDSKITDNGDGTYTISADTVNAVLQVICNSYIDGTLTQDENGNYVYGGYTTSFTYTFSDESYITRNISVTGTSFTINKPIAIYLNACYDNTSNSGFFPYVYDKTDGLRFLNNLDIVNGGNHTKINTVINTKNNSSSEYVSSENNGFLSTILSGSKFVPLEATYSIPFAVFDNLIMLENALKSGNYSNALNYIDNSGLEFGSNYTGTYSGGDITVSASVLNGIGAKIDELNQTNKSTDEKLQELLDYIKDGEEEEETGENGGGTGSDDDEEVGGSSWLEKIYNVLEKILDKVKSIRRWVIADTIIDGVDLVADIGNLILNLLEEPLEAVGAIGKSLSGADSLLKDKFPFSIPWDIALLVGFLSHEPVCPEFILPLKLERYGIDEEIVLSLEEFEFCSKISRAMFTVIFCYGLTQITVKIVGMKKGG